jgi:hypothetical protein
MNSRRAGGNQPVVLAACRLFRQNGLFWPRVVDFSPRSFCLPMVFDQIEKKKREYTDKYVMVDASRPELARFRDVVGQVKTVNMNGRVLVEFMDYHLNVGWYDIDPEFLKVVEKPPPKAEKPAAKKPAAKAEAKPAAAKAPAAKAPAAKAPAAAKAGKPSVADILAAARAGTAGGAAPASTTPAAPKGEAGPATAPAAAKPAAKVDRSKMSVADMLAAARAGGAAGVVQAKVQSVSKPAPASAEEAPEEATPVVAAAPEEEKETEPVATAPAPMKSTERMDKSKMSIDDMVAWCRAHDTK